MFNKIGDNHSIIIIDNTDDIDDKITRKILKKTVKKVVDINKNGIAPIWTKDLEKK